VALAALALALTFPASVRAADAGCWKEAVSTLPTPPVHSDMMGGRQVLSYVPAHAKGIVYLFHGSGGSETFATRVHTARVLSALIAAGYGYAASASLDRDVKRWDVSSLDPKANRDVAYMLGLHKALIEKGAITAKTPVFTMGMSNGGAFANLYATAAKQQGLPVVAVADYMGPFPAPMRDLLKDARALPSTFLVLSERDGLVDAKRVTEIASQLKAAGGKIEVHLNTEHTVCPATFTVVPGLDAAQREDLVAKVLPAAGLIDAKGARAVFTDKPVMDRDALLELYRRTPGGPQSRLIADELIIAWAGHQMRSEYAARQVAFFDAALAAGR
jgi:dienelactone hydrolase